MDVQRWLESLHMEQFADVIIASGFTSLDICQTMSEETLVALGIGSPIHRNRILQSLASMHTAQINQMRGRLYTGEDFGLNRVLSRVDDLHQNISTMEAAIAEGDEPPPGYDDKPGGLAVDGDLDSMLAQLCDFGSTPVGSAGDADGGIRRDANMRGSRMPARSAPVPPPAQPAAASASAASVASPGPPLPTRSMPPRTAAATTSLPLGIGLEGNRAKAASFEGSSPVTPPNESAEGKFGRSRSVRNLETTERPVLSRNMSSRNKTPEEMAERLSHLRKRISTDTNGKLSAAQLDALMEEDKVRIAMEKLAEASVSKDTIKFFFEDKTTKTLVVESIDTATQICTKLANKNGLLDEPNLQIVEHCPSLHIERYLEDHESVTDAFRMWPPVTDNMLLLRRNPLKYDLFINPARYFARLLQDDLKDTPTERAEKAKKLLMQEYFKSTVKTPELSGYLNERTGTKKWKRRFFLLRASGMYISLKGESKESKDLETYVRFEDRDVCTTFDYIKYAKAPTEFCIAFKPRVRKQEISLDDMRAVCFTSEEELDSWLAGMRLAKFGSKLRDNYETTLRQVDRLVEMGAAPIDLQQEIQSNVPLAVSQPAKNTSLIREWKTVRSKVHPGISAATGVEFGSSEDEDDDASEQQQQQRQQQLQLLQQQQQQQQQQLLLQQQQQQQQMASVKRQMSAAELSRSLLPLPYFHGRISRDTAEGYFKERHNEPGLFLLRESQSSPGSYVLSVVTGGARPYQHFQIHTTPGGFQIANGPIFEDMEALVEHHSLEQDGLGQLLQRSVFRLSDELP